LYIKYYQRIQHVLFSSSHGDGAWIQSEETFHFKTVQNMLDYFKVYPLYFLNEETLIKLTKPVCNYSKPMSNSATIVKAISLKLISNLYNNNDNATELHQNNERK